MELQERARELFLSNGHTGFCWQPTVHRDSGVLDQSNGAEFDKVFKPIAGWIDGDGDDVESRRKRNSAVGWQDGYEIRIYDASGEPTEAFRLLHGLLERLENCDILNEDDFYAREYNAQIESIEEYKNWDYTDDSDDWPENWVGLVWEWLNENGKLSGEDVSWNDVNEAMGELGLLD